MNATIVEQILQQDRVWAAYALADLQPEFAPHCRWLPVREEGVVLLFDGLTPTVIFAMGGEAVVEEALAAVSLPQRVYVNVREYHLPVLQRHYDFGDDVRPMFRLQMVDSEIATQSECSVTIPLRREDSPRIQQLYANGGPFARDAFGEYQIENGFFFGVESDGELVAIGGTHVLDLTRGIATVGNMYTHPEHRGQGHATCILAALVHEFVRHRMQTVVMNVDQRNAAARRLYEKLGFEVYCPYLEGIGETNRNESTNQPVNESTHPSCEPSCSEFRPPA